MNIWNHLQTNPRVLERYVTSNEISPETFNVGGLFFKNKNIIAHNLFTTCTQRAKSNIHSHTYFRCIAILQEIGDIDQETEVRRGNVIGMISQRRFESNLNDLHIIIKVLNNHIAAMGRETASEGQAAVQSGAAREIVDCELIFDLWSWIVVQLASSSDQDF